MHPMFKWLRAAGIGTELFGWGGLVLAGLFRPAVWFIYGGFAILALDLWYEPDLRKRSVWWRIVGSLVIGAGAALFSFGIVLVKAPLGISALLTDGEYADGVVINGIAWRREFT